MPLVFIHGVNTRDTDPGYQKDVAARDELFRRLLLQPLADKSARFTDSEILNIYWGKHGVQFAWGQQSLPEVRPLEHLGVEAETTPASDLEFTAIVDALTSTGVGNGVSLEGLGAREDQIAEAAKADLSRFMEAVLAPIILSERDLALGTGEDPEFVGKREALLLIAGDETAGDPAVQAIVKAAASEQEVLASLKEAVLQRFGRLLVERGLLTSEGSESLDGDLEGLGPGWLSEIKDRAGEFFDRARNAPVRAATIPAFAKVREDMHRNLTRFLGDVFVYLNQRSHDEPGPIVNQVLHDIREIRRRHPDGPLIVVTHSMGGNIFYDILTNYAPDLEVDAWVSIGGQVGQFEEMKLFRRSDPSLRAPQKVASLRPRVKYWLNVYDPADPFSFLAAPIFEDVEDESFLTGSSVFKSHGDYFKRPSFYHLLRERMESAML